MKTRYEWGRNTWAVNRWEEDRCRREVESNITLQMYCNKMRKYIAIVLEQTLAVVLFQCRTNTLRLKQRQGFAGGAGSNGLSFMWS